MIYYITTTQRVRQDDGSQLCINVDLPYETVEDVSQALARGNIVGMRVYSRKVEGRDRLRKITGRSQMMLSTAGIAMIQLPSVDFEEAADAT